MEFVLKDFLTILETNLVKRFVYASHLCSADGITMLARARHLTVYNIQISASINKIVGQLNSWDIDWMSHKPENFTIPFL